MLHGSWHLLDEPLIPLLSGLLFVLVMILVFGGTMLTARFSIETRGPGVISSVRLASIAVVINYVATFLTIARFWDYEIFVVPLVVPVLAALTAKVLRNRGSRIMHRLILGAWLVLAFFLFAVRSGKVLTSLASYHARDPQPLQEFVTANVTRNSRVFGPEEFYFYAVEAAGSHYLFVKAISPNGLVTTLNEVPNWQEQLKASSPVYLIWPNGLSIPRGLVAANLHLEARFTPPPEKGLAWWRRAGPGPGSGYPATNLYRIVDGKSSANEPAK